MGKGDKKSRKGKIAIGSFGKKRPHQVKKAAVAAPVKKEEKPVEAAKKPNKPVEKAKKTEKPPA